MREEQSFSIHMRDMQKNTTVDNSTSSQIEIKSADTIPATSKTQ